MDSRERPVAHEPVDAARRHFGVEYPQGSDVVAPSRRGRIERLEEFATATFFTVMFATLLAGVFWRYVLNRPLVWTVGVSTLGFIWAALVGSGLCDRDDGHVQFDLVYNRFSERTQTICRMVGNGIIVVTFALVVPGTLSYLQFVHRQRVVGLPLRFSWAYAVVLLFLLSTILHRGKLLWVDVRGLLGRRGDLP